MKAELSTGKDGQSDVFDCFLTKTWANVGNSPCGRRWLTQSTARPQDILTEAGAARIPRGLDRVSIR
ncbi:hypothetical protein BN13_140030 [Nostocoides jenkinsii Ben 74]|uniref:Uncharacterized protein n=1 Tax=Nostocoides jenkinsii Ben 74 TaxID=1193518 RepID=A0A077MBK7_9MICO|nr:hypothetical protein BN13_140030 [Tetrasphaera jenkinsii Ben 74]